jgi:TIGR00159 family protein
MDAFSGQMADVWKMILNVAKGFAFKDAVDIALVSFLIYTIINFMKETRVGQLVKGILLLVVIQFGAAQFGMTMLDTLLTEFFEFAVVALIILFQPEIRKALEQMGHNSVGRSIIGVFSAKESKEDLQVKKAIDSVVEAAAMLQQLRMGALVVFERGTNLTEIAESGTMMDAEPTSQLLGNIFFNKAPLHDGALIIRKGKLLAAGCILPLTRRENVNSALGTRHRAALGISEDSDAIALVVSEETGQISIAYKGTLTRDFNRVTLTEVLEEMLIDTEEKAIPGNMIWKKIGMNSGKRGDSRGK